MAVVVRIDSDSEGPRQLRTAELPMSPLDPIGGDVPPGFRPMSATWISALQG